MANIRNSEKNEAAPPKTGRADKMTVAQASYLKTLCTEAGEPFLPDLNRSEASRRIDELRRKTGRRVAH